MNTTPSAGDKAQPILIVDDVAAARRVVRRMLTSLGYSNLLEAGSVDEGKKMVSEQTFKLVISDVHLKDGTAIDLIQSVRDNLGENAPGFLVVTSDLDIQTFENVSKQNVTSYLLKPFNPKMLEDSLAECFQTLAKAKKK